MFSFFRFVEALSSIVRLWYFAVTDAGEIVGISSSIDDLRGANGDQFMDDLWFDQSYIVADELSESIMNAIATPRAYYQCHQKEWEGY